MPKTWTAMTVTVPEPIADAVGSFLIDHGAPGLESEEGAGFVRITAHFAGAPPVDALRSFCEVLAAEIPGAPQAAIGVEVIAEQPWAESWKDHFPPLCVGSRLFVHPPWIREVPAGRAGIAIDPGMAFGTGHHPSTRGCLVLLEKYIASARDARVLDVGIGSGILAIAAAKLGARRVVGVDTDPEAREIAAQNAIANRIANIELRESVDDVRERFEIVVANLLARPLIDLSARLYDLLAPGGVLIGSGMLAEEARVVGDAWQRTGLTALESHVEDGWATLAYARPDAERR